MKFSDLNVHLSYQKMLYEATQKYYRSEYTSCALFVYFLYKIILQIAVIYRDKSAIFFSCCYATKLGKFRRIFSKQTDVAAGRFQNECNKMEIALYVVQFSLKSNL